MRDGSDCAALGRAVELGQCQSGHAQGVVERLHLGDGILPGVGIQHEQHLVGRTGNGFLDDPFHLADFFHQMQLGGQTPRSVCEHYVDITGTGSGDGIEDDRSGIALVLTDDGDAVAFAPDLQLFACGCAEVSPAARRTDSPWD
jgi:hypothetical protein